MEKVTLGNQDLFNDFKNNMSEPESLTDLIKLKTIKDSLIDLGVTDFKEITDMNQISFGHFIILEKILGLEMDDFDKRLKLLAPIILRPLDEVKLDNSDAEKERKHKEKVFDEPIGNVIGAFNRFFQLRHDYLFKTYNGVIYGTLNEDEDEDEDEEGTQIDSSQSAREFHTKKFFWNTMISNVAGGDIFKFNEAVDLMMYVVMPYLAEKRSLEIVETLEAKARR